MVSEITRQSPHASFSETAATGAAKDAASAAAPAAPQLIAEAEAEAAEDSKPEGLTIEPEALQSAVQDIRKQASNLQRSLEFSVDEASGRTVITVIDKATDEIIRQIPPEEALTLAERIQGASGALMRIEV